MRALIYVRRSYRPNGAPDISDEAQEAAARALLPPDATVEVLTDSGGHQSGRSDRRDAYRELIRRVEAGACDALAVYDLSRLARNARLMLNLKAALERRSIDLRVANMPYSQWDSAVGRFMFGQLCLAAQFQADLDSERMAGLMRTTFLDGRHRGNPPRGYVNGRDDNGRRALVVDPAAAARVRQVVALLAERSFSDVAALLTADGYPMSTSAVKDVARRLPVYVGFVVAGRGPAAETRTGRHEPLISDAEYRAALAGIGGRLRAGARSRPWRTYLLSGVIGCECGRSMGGEARSSRGREWRYYRCRDCRRTVPAADAEAAVLSRLTKLPPLTRRLIDRADAEARARSVSPARSLAAARRDELERSIAAVRKQHEWGALSDVDFRAALAAKRAELERLPDPDVVVAFRRARAVIESIGQLIAAGEPADHRRLIRAVVERVETADRRVSRVTLAPAIREAVWMVCPRTGARARHPDSVPAFDALEAALAEVAG